MDTLGWQELKVVALAVDDLARAESFYRSRLGLERRLQADGDVGFALGGLTILLKPLAAELLRRSGGTSLGRATKRCPRRRSICRKYERSVPTVKS